QAILEQRPRLIVLERLFAATPRGAALINRIKTDPQLGHAEVRVMSHTGDYTRQVAKPAADAAPAAAAAGGAVGSRAPAWGPGGGAGRGGWRPRSRGRPSRRGRSTGTARAERRASACVPAS